MNKIQELDLKLYGSHYLTMAEENQALDLSLAVSFVKSVVFQNGKIENKFE